MKRYTWTPASEPPGIREYIRTCQRVRILLCQRKVLRLLRDVQKPGEGE